VGVLVGSGVGFNDGDSVEGLLVGLDVGLGDVGSVVGSLVGGRVRCFLGRSVGSGVMTLAAVAAPAKMFAAVEGVVLGDNNTGDNLLVMSDGTEAYVG